jgi:hypothetical protein
MYYFAGGFLAVCIAALLSNVARRRRHLAAIAVTSVILWNGYALRFYLDEARDGAEMVRSIAGAVASISEAEWGAGVLIVAPAVIGTFSSAATTSWSVRPAVVLHYGKNPSGPLFFAESCTALLDGQAVVNEANVEVRRMDYGRVVAWNGVKGETHFSLAAACPLASPAG